MSVLLVTYDLTEPDPDYTDLIDAIKSYGCYCHDQKSVWFLDTEKSPESVREHLLRYLKTTRGDTIFIDTLHRKWSSWSKEDTVLWLNSADRTWD